MSCNRKSWFSARSSVLVAAGFDSFADGDFTSARLRLFDAFYRSSAQTRRNVENRTKYLCPLFWAVRRAQLLPKVGSRTHT